MPTRILPQSHPRNPATPSQITTWRPGAIRFTCCDGCPKRQKALKKAGQADVYQYEFVPVPLRNQVIHIFRDAIGTETQNHEGPYRRWEFVHDTMAREKGLMSLSAFARTREACEQWFAAASHEDALDFIELGARVIDALSGKLAPLERRVQNVSVSAAEALKELNARFREHDVGFQYENGVLIKLDSQYLHANVVRPALGLLNAEPFLKANEDFLTAHKHFREGHHKDCIVACHRAFESVLKAVCKALGWKFASGDRASELIAVVRNAGLFPAYLDKSFDTYIAMLKTGLPDVRNNAGGHGEAPEAQPVPSYIAAYALHLSATNILMTVEASNSHKR